MKIAVISANLGNFDNTEQHVPQSIPNDYFLFTDENFPPRFKAMTPRLQAKIPKCFGWQMVPDYDYYLWIDADLVLKSPDSLKYFYESCKKYDVVVLKHPRRISIGQEALYLERNKTSRYLSARYQNELLKEQMAEINADKDFVDDMLFIGTVFMYRNTLKVQKMLKEWWYHISRYHIIDQLAFPYVLKKSGLRINVRDDKYNDCPYLELKPHRYYAK